MGTPALYLTMDEIIESRKVRDVKLAAEKRLKDEKKAERECKTRTNAIVEGYWPCKVHTRIRRPGPGLSRMLRAFFSHVWGRLRSGNEPYTIEGGFQ